MDPVIALALRAGLGLLFAAAAWHKLADRAAFRAAVAEYRVLPAAVSGLASAVLLALEIAAAAALLAPLPAWPGALLAAGLLAAYAAAIGVNLARGRRDLDCGCLGPARRQPIGFGLIARNAVLAAAALLCLLPVRARPLGWLDAVTVAGAVAAAALLHAAIEQMMVAAPALARLRSDA